MVTISDWDASKFLNNEDDIIAYLNAVMEYDDPALFQQAIGNVAKARGMVGIKGHRLVGGFRASCYNALPIESVQALVGCMQEFEKLHLK